METYNKYQFSMKTFVHEHQGTHFTSIFHLFEFSVAMIMSASAKDFSVFNLSLLTLCVSCFFLCFSYTKDTYWSPCSVTCGEGVRTKQYRCKIFLEFSKTLATLHNDTFCSGSKPPPDVEHCVMEPCSMAYGYDEQYIPRQMSTPTFCLH